MLRLMGLGYLLLFRGSSRSDMAVMGTPDTQTGNLTLKEVQSQTSEEGQHNRDL